MRIVLPALAVLALLAGCATGPADQPDNTTPSFPGLETVIAAPGEVRGQGTVLQIGEAAPQFCLGAVMESYPPQCSGPELIDWDWDAYQGDEIAGDVRFGAYAVSGNWDGIRLTVSSAIMLALYDPIPYVDPLLDPASTGDADPAELERIQAELTADGSPLTPLMTSIENGYLFVTVLYDDGSIQAWADETYLPDAVAIRGALRGVG